MQSSSDNSIETFLANGQVIQFSDTAKDECWKLVPLYKETATGAIDMWQIGFDPLSDELKILFGQIDGKKQIKKREVVTNASGRDKQTQALLEARQRYTKKYYKGYHPAGDTSELITSPMLANEYFAGGYSEKEKKNKRTNVSRFPVACMPKLDGIRSLIFKSGHQIMMRSRENRNQIYSDEHFKELRQQLAPFFIYLPERAILDGELYNHDIDFNTLTSAVKTQKFVHPLLKQVKYCIFDIIEPLKLPFNQRYDLLLKAYYAYCDDCQNGLVTFNQSEQKNMILDTFLIIPNTLANSHEEIASFHDYYVRYGYEGLIIRKLVSDNPSTTEIGESQYRSTRCNNLLKYKHFIDEEGIIEDVSDGTGSDSNLAIFVIRDIRDNLIRVRPRGTEGKRHQWFEDKAKIIGKKYTFRYFNLTPDNIPRFPTGKGFRDYE